MRRGARLVLLGVAGLLLARYLAWCRRFVEHERARAERPPGFSGGVNATS